MITIELEEHLKESLQHIEKKLIDSSIKRALVSMVKPIKAQMKATAPKHTGLMGRAISHSVEFNRKKSLAVAYVGLSKKNHPAWLITRGLAHEYGNARTQAQPFIAPIAKINRQNVLDDFHEFFEQHLDKLLSKQ